MAHVDATVLLDLALRFTDVTKELVGSDLVEGEVAMLLNALLKETRGFEARKKGGNVRGPGKRLGEVDPRVYVGGSNGDALKVDGGVNDLDREGNATIVTNDANVGGVTDVNGGILTRTGGRGR